jgi:hypothetical protein
LLVASLMLSKIFLFALPLAVFACAATTESPGGGDEDEGSSEEAYTSSRDVTADYVAAYQTPPNTPAGDVTSLRLRKDRTFVLVQGGATEQGTYEVRKTGTATDLRLTLPSGSKKTFKVSLGAAETRPTLEITRNRKTSRLERQLTSCAAVNCLTGMGCDVVETDGVPGPVCSPRTPAWKTALATYDLWGGDFSGVIPGSYGNRGSLSCGVSVSAGNITCGTVGWNGWAVSAPIAEGGTFLTGTPQGDDNYLAGKIASDGQVTLTAWRKKECYSVPSGRFCDGKSTDTGGTAKPYEMCRTKDLVFQSGGWASGYFTKCSSCTPEMECTRYPAK